MSHGPPVSLPSADLAAATTPTSDRGPETILWSWVPPLVLAILLLLLWVSGTNEAWFARINGWSTRTGPEPWSELTTFGDALVLLALALPVLWGRPRWAWALVAAAILTAAVTHTLKPWLDLPRPAAVLGADEITIIGPELRSKAMPSGHSAAAFTVAGVLVPAMRKRGLRSLVLMMAVLAGVTRVVVGAHWPTDVLVGALIGWMSGAVALRLVEERKWTDAWPARSALAITLAGCAVALLFTRTGYPGTYPVQVVVALFSLCFGVLIARQAREAMRNV